MNPFVTQLLLLYVEYAAVTITLNLLGRYLEIRSENRSAKEIRKAMGDISEKAHVLRDGVEEEIEINEIIPGEFVMVRPGELFPANGIVIEGISSVDESKQTGESLSVKKSAGEHVLAGSRNLNETVKYQVTSFSATNDIPEDENQSAQGLTRTLAKYRIWTSILLTFGAVTVWCMSGRSLLHLEIAVSVFILACPCTMGFAVSMPLSVGMKRAQESGLLIKRTSTLPDLHRAEVILFDKTGTVTEGKLRVTDIRRLVRISEDRLIQIAASAVHRQSYMFSQTFLDEAAKQQIELEKASEIKTSSLHGVEAVLDDKEILLGNEAFIKEHGFLDKEAMEIAREYEQEGKSAVFVAADREFAGIICVSDVVKDSSREAIEQLAALGKEIIMVTGDSDFPAGAVAAQAGIQTFYAGLSSEEKTNRVKMIQADGHRTVMAGDGIHDTGAIAQADTGIVMGCETGGVTEAADIVLPEKDLMGVVRVLQLSKRTSVFIKESLFFAAFIHFFGTFAVLGLSYVFTGRLLTPFYIQIIMVLGILSVLIQAFRFYKRKDCV